jgi:hypothetical protein
MQLLHNPIKSGLPRHMISTLSLTAYGGLLPVGTSLEKLGFRQLVEETLNVKRQTRAMPAHQFILAMVLACYVGFSRLHHMRFLPSRLAFPPCRRPARRANAQGRRAADPTGFQGKGPRILAEMAAFAVADATEYV